VRKRFTEKDKSSPQGLPPIRNSSQPAKNSGEKIDIENTKKLYSIICNRAFDDCSDHFRPNCVCPDHVLKRVLVIEHLEHVTGRQFRNTKEFHQIVSQYIARNGEKQIPLQKQFKKKRINLGLNQTQVAEQLKVDRRTIIRWEQGSTPLTPKAIEWIYQSLPSEGEPAPAEDEHADGGIFQSSLEATNA